MNLLLDSYNRAFKAEAFSVVRRRKIDGRKRFEELSFNPIRDLHEEAIGVNCFLRDLTGPQRYLQRIENQNERLREITWIQSHRAFAPEANILRLTRLISLEDSTGAGIISGPKKAAVDRGKVIREITVLKEDLIDP